MARNFNGSTDFLDNPNAAVLSSPFTFAIWAWSTSWAGQYALFVQGNSGIGAGQALDFGGVSTKLACTVDYGVTFASSNATPANSTWVHMAMTYDGGASPTTVLFVNGVAQTATANTTANFTNSNDVQIGRNPTSGNPFAGSLADAAVWSIVLSGSNITNLAAGRRANTQQPGSLLRYWPIICQSPEPDLANGFNATVTGTTCVSDPPSLDPLVTAILMPQIVT